MIIEMIFISLLTTVGVPPKAIEPVAFKSVACDFFTHDNAIKVLGGKATGADTGMTDTAEGRKWGCTFTASDRGETPPKLYFMLVKSPSDEVAKRAFDTVRQSNKSHAGFEEWPGIGDEAVVHTDGKNFQFVMVRKGVKTIRVKVNPAEGVSMDTLKSAVTSIIPKLSNQ